MSGRDSLAPVSEPRQNSAGFDNTAAADFEPRSPGVGRDGSMRIIATRATAVAAMLLVLGLARWLGQFGTSFVIAGCLAAAASLTAILVLARR